MQSDAPKQPEMPSYDEMSVSERRVEDLIMEAFLRVSNGGGHPTHATAAPALLPLNLPWMSHRDQLHGRSHHHDDPLYLP